MSALAKVFIVLNFVLSIVFLASAGVLLAKTDEWRAKYEAERTKHDSDVQGLETQRKDLQTNLSSVTSDKDGLKRDLGDAQNVRDKYKEDLGTEQKVNVDLRKSVDETAQTLKTIQATLASAQDQIASLQKGKEEAEAKMREAVDKQRQAEAEVTRLRSEGDDKAGQIESLGKQIAALTDERDKLQTVIAVAREAGFRVDELMAQPAINGKVMDVDSKVGVVVLSVGSQADVKKGFRFQVYRGGDYVGEVIVDAVYPDLSAASVVKLRPGMEIKKLDDVTTRL